MPSFLAMSPTPYLRELVGEDAVADAIEGHVALKELGIEEGLDVLIAAFPRDPRTILGAPKGALKLRRENGTSIEGRTG